MDAVLPERCAQLINATWAEQTAVPGYPKLAELAAQIQSDQDRTVGFSRQLINLFGSKNPLLQLGRGIGLNSLDRHPSFSRVFALNSMGLLSAPPRSYGVQKTS